MKEMLNLLTELSTPYINSLKNYYEKHFVDEGFLLDDLE